MKITVIKKNTQLLKEVGGAKRKRSPIDDERRSFYNFQMEKIIYKISIAQRGRVAQRSITRPRVLLNLKIAVLLKIINEKIYALRKGFCVCAIKNI